MLVKPKIDLTLDLTTLICSRPEYMQSRCGNEYKDEYRDLWDCSVHDSHPVTHYFQLSFSGVRRSVLFNLTTKRKHDNHKKCCKIVTLMSKKNNLVIVGVELLCEKIISMVYLK